MSESYALFALTSDSLPRVRAREVLLGALSAAGATGHEDDALVFNDVGEHEREPERTSPFLESDLDKILAWPSLGGTGFSLGAVSPSLHLETLNPGGGVDCVQVAIGQRMFDDHEADVFAGVRGLAGNLHASLRASRTVFGWGLEMQGFDWRQEVRRVRRGVYTGSFPMLDLRP